MDAKPDIVSNAIAQLQRRPLKHGQEKRAQLVQIITDYFCQIDNMIDDKTMAYKPKAVEYTANLIHLFASDRLSKLEKNPIARRLSVPLLDKSLQYYFSKKMLRKLRNTSGLEIFSSMHQLTDGVTEIVNRHAPHIDNYAGNYLVIFNLEKETMGLRSERCLMINRKPFEEVPQIYPLFE